MPTLKHPVTFARRGGGALILLETETAYYDQALKAAVSVERGELLLDPSFGTEDPTFARGEPVGLRATVAAYWPEISIRSVDVGEPNNSGTTNMKIDYEVG